MAFTSIREQIGATGEEQSVTKGRVWLGADGLFYWSCTVCLQKALKDGLGVLKEPPGGRARTAADGNDYVKWHWDARHSR